MKVIFFFVMLPFSQSGRCSCMNAIFQNSERLAANALIAADLGLYDLNGVISFDSVTDDTGTPGKWVVTGSNNYATSDGTHPSQIMDGLMAGVAQPVVAAFTV